MRSGDEASERKPLIDWLKAYNFLKRFRFAENQQPVTTKDPHSEAEEPDRLSRVSPLPITITTQPPRGEGQGEGVSDFGHLVIGFLPDKF